MLSKKHLDVKMTVLTIITITLFLKSRWKPQMLNLSLDTFYVSLPYLAFQKYQNRTLFNIRTQ